MNYYLVIEKTNPASAELIDLEALKKFDAEGAAVIERALLDRSLIANAIEEDLPLKRLYKLPENLRNEVIGPMGEALPVKNKVCIYPIEEYNEETLRKLDSVEG